MDCSPPGSSVHGILQARTLEWVAIPSSKGSSQPRDQTQVSCIVGGLFTIWASRGILLKSPSRWYWLSLGTAELGLWLFQISVCTGILGILLKCRFWFSRYELRLGLSGESLHFVLRSLQSFSIRNDFSISLFHVLYNFKDCRLPLCRIALCLGPWDTSSWPNFSFTVSAGMPQNETGIVSVHHNRRYRMTPRGHIDLDHVTRSLYHNITICPW